MPNGAPDLVPAAFGQGGGLFEQDLLQGQQVRKKKNMKAVLIAGLTVIVCAAVALIYVFLVRE